ncbi:chromosomal replication initiation ATPase DnaA [Sphingobium sp. B1D7B]|nr:chromosomal replication initiation ATPase DnaA [Sphingobium sp. B1D7B]
MSIQDLKKDSLGWHDYPSSCARIAAYRLIREELKYSYPRIGRIMRRDHSTVMSGIRRANELLATDPNFAAAYERARQG